MEEIKVVYQLPEGEFYGKGQKYSDADIGGLYKLYNDWRNMNNLLKDFASRKIRLPGGLSEPLFCIAKEMIRVTSNIPGASSSFDIYDPNSSLSHNRIVFKASSVVPDLTSFEPHSGMDRLFFMDFYRTGMWDGTFDIYEIDVNQTLSIKLKSKETVREQMLQGRRPRFSIYREFIENQNYLTKETFELSRKELWKYL